MRKIGLPTTIAVLACTSALAQQPAPSQPYPPTWLNPKVPTETRITDLLAHMTVEEKIEAFGTNPTVARLGVVGTGHDEGLHGTALGGPGHWEGRGLPVIPTTTFPQARGLGQMWDPALLTQLAAEEAYETRYAAVHYERGGLVMRAPNADLSRDPRWGRSEESYGEDPFFVGTNAVAFTRGLQGQGSYWINSSLLKHFLANENEDGRDSSSSDYSERLFREYYSVPFRMAIEQGHADAMMASYNAWNGTPMAVNPIFHSIVQKEWGFDGIFCTDGGGLTNLVKAYHRYPTMAEAAAATIKAGINQYLDDFKPGLTEAVEKHMVSEAELDRNLRGVFRVMIHLGLLDPHTDVPESHIGFDHTGSAAGKPEGDPWNWPQNRTLARRATEESIVLLKDQPAAGAGKPLLPLDSRGLHSIAVIGPYADEVIADWYSGTPYDPVTPVAGITRRAGPAIKVTYNPGTDLAAAAQLAAASDVAIVIIGNHPYCNATRWKQCDNPSDGREAVDRKSLTLGQEDIAKAVFAANPRTVVVLQASFPYTTTWSQANIPAILTLTHNSEEQGTGLADVLFGDFNPGGRLTQTWVEDIADLPPMMDYNLADGHTYLYAKKKPLYAFGYGLSYTTFTYSNLKVSAPRLAANGTEQVTFTLKNTGSRDGDEVGQLYIAHEGSKVPRPIHELKAFSRIHLKAGESREVTLTFAAKDLAYWQESTHSFVVEPDQVQVAVGGSSDNLPLTTTVAVVP